MSTLEKEIAALRAQLDETTGKEMRLVRDLDNALRQADAQLMDQLEKALLAHHQRRTNIMAGLDALKSYMASPQTLEPVRHQELRLPETQDHNLLN